MDEIMKNRNCILSKMALSIAGVAFFSRELSLSLVDSRSTSDGEESKTITRKLKFQVPLQIPTIIAAFKPKKKVSVLTTDSPTRYLTIVPHF